MVTIYIGGGLANKMFQYAFSLAIKQKGYNIMYDTISFKTEFSHDQIELDDIFSNIHLNRIEKLNHRFAGKQGRLARLLKRYSPKYVIEHAYQFNDMVFKQIKDGCYIESSWQDERYFIDAEEEVRNAFKFPLLVDERNIEVANEMSLSNSVAIHIRKGDGYGSWNIFSNTCQKDYYKRALDYIHRSVDNPKFFVFTDTPEIVSDYLDINDYSLINWNPTTGNNNYLDMQLMSCAKHNIIANSTYSWWGAWLNNNPNKIVVAPYHWFNPNSKWAEVNHIIPNKWIKL